MTKGIKATYDVIAQDFSCTREHPWPEFDIFLSFIPDGIKLLDLGCGNGRFYGYLQKKKKIVDYTGIDISPNMLKKAKEKYPMANFVEQDMSQFQWNEKFDRIICIAAFHHLRTKALRKKTLRIIARHLSEDGFLLLSVWNLWQWKYRKLFLKGIFRFLFSGFKKDPRDVFVPFGVKKNLRYYHAFLHFELRSLLKTQGFQIELETISRHNFLFVARKKILVTPRNPIFVKERQFLKQFDNSPVSAISSQNIAQS